MAPRQTRAEMRAAGQLGDAKFVVSGFKGKRKRPEQMMVDDGSADSDSRYAVDFMPRLNEFVPAVAPPVSLFATLTVYGKRKTGKTVFVKWFMQALDHQIPWAWLFTRTKFNSAYESWLPSKFIITSFDATALRDIMTRQQVAVGLCHEEQAEKGDRASFNPRAWVGWDDYNGSDIKYNEVLNDYYYTGRHYWTFNTFCAQHITLTPPAIRANTDLAVLFSTDYEPAMEHYWRDFAGKMDRTNFYKLFYEATMEPNSFLAIDNNPNTPYDEKFFTGKAEMLDESIEWIFGCAEYWKDNMEQLAAIKKGVYIRMAETTAKMSEYVPKPKKTGEGYYGQQAPSAWMPFRFPAPCPGEGELETRVEERKKNPSGSGYEGAFGGGVAGAHGNLLMPSGRGAGHNRNPAANPSANINRMTNFQLNDFYRANPTLRPAAPTTNRNHPTGRHLRTHR